MADTPLRINGLAWAHFRVRGGWRSILSTVGAYAAIIVGLIYVCVRIEPRKSQDILYGWTLVLLGLQAGALLLVACSTLRTTVRRDIEGGMLESHRLMPISDLAAVAGYITGATAQALVGAGVNFVIGTVTAAGGGLGVFDWFAANGLLVVFAVVCWIGTVLLSLISKSAFGMALAIAVIGTMTGGFLPALLPGLMLLAGPAIKGTVFEIVIRGISWGPEYPLSLSMQIMAGGLLFLAAARRFRRDDVPAFGTLLGLGLLLGWSVVSAAGIQSWKGICPNILRQFISGVREIQVICSTLAAVIVAIIPVSNAARSEMEWYRRRRLNDPALGPRPLQPTIVALAAAVIVLLIPMTTLGNRRMVAAGPLPMIVSVGAMVLGLRYLLGIMHSIRRPTVLVVILWLGGTWFGPLLIDMFSHQMNWIDFGNPPFTMVSAFSPIGVFIAAIDDINYQVLSGVVFQCLMAAVMGYLFHRVSATLRKAEPQATG